MRKTIVLLFVFITAVLSSCVQENRSSKEIVIQKICGARACSFELVEADVLLQTNFLGKQRKKVLQTHVLDTQDNSSLIWRLSVGSSFATSEQMIGLPACENDQCSPSANPTGVFFEDPGGFSIEVSGRVTLSDGTVVDVDKSTDIIIDEFPTRLTYRMPSGSTMTAVEAATRFESFEYKDNVAEVIGQGGTDGTLTFICKEGTYIDPIAIGLAEGSSQNIGDWTKITSVFPTPTFTGGSWHSLSLVAAVNNADLLEEGVYQTGIDCGPKKLTNLK